MLEQGVREGRVCHAPEGGENWGTATKQGQEAGSSGRPTRAAAAAGDYCPIPGATFCTAEEIPRARTTNAPTLFGSSGMIIVFDFPATWPNSLM